MGNTSNIREINCHMNLCVACAHSLFVIAMSKKQGKMVKSRIRVNTIPEKAHLNIQTLNVYGQDHTWMSRDVSLLRHV